MPAKQSFRPACALEASWQALVCGIIMRTWDDRPSS
jgi:hypothetical protein